MTTREQAQWVLALYRACLLVDGVGSLLVFSAPRDRAQALAYDALVRTIRAVPMCGGSRRLLFRRIRSAIDTLDEAVR